MKRWFVAAILLTTPAFSQQTIFWGDEGVEPKVPLTSSYGDRYVMVTVPKSPLLADYRNSTTQLPHQTSFREVFKAFREDSAHQYYLVKSKGEPVIWGWIDKRFLLYERYGKRSEDKNNPTFIKAALRNNLQVDVSERVNLRSGPGPSYGIVETNGLAQILYVYDQKKAAGGIDYLLLGWDAEWNPERPTESIRGWVRKDQCTIWDHRIAVYYNRKNIGSRKPVSVFKTVAELTASQSTGDTSGAIAVESPNSDKALTFDRSRFPVLQYGPQMKIAFIGAPPRDLTIGVSDINQKVEQIRNMQILFVIDGTVSMGRYFQEVQKAVRDYISSIPTDQERERHHFAAAVYRDYEDGPNGEMEFVADFDDRKALDKLGSVKEYSSPDDKTFEEAVFNGIIRAVKRATWQPGSLKVVVVIGDDPNHSPDTDKNGYTPQSVVKALKDFSGLNLESGFRFNAINVNVSDSHRQLNDEFVNQMKQIGNQFKPAGLFPQIRTDAGDLEKFRQAVTAALRNVIKTSEGVGNVLTEFKQGKSANQVAAIYGTELTNLAIRLLSEVGVKPSVIDERRINQISMDGWVQMSANGQQMMEPWVYIERTELDEFRGFLASLLRSSQQRQRASEIIKDAVVRTTGNPLMRGETIADFVKQAFAIPFRDDSTILSKTPEQLQEALSTQSYVTQFRKRVGYSYEVLGLVSAEQDPSILAWDHNNDKWVRTSENPKRVKTWVTSSGGQTYCWIPFDFIP